MTAYVKQLMVATVLATVSGLAVAEELEPRRWTHTPIGLNTLSLGYSYTQADILFDPASRLEDVELDLHAWGAKYLHAFNLFGRTARVEATMGYAVGRWRGLLDGQSASTERDGLTDSQLRFAVNLIGAPALSGKEFQDYRAQTPNETIVGVAVNVLLPTGEYDADKFINLGGNRYIIRPQVGVLQNLGVWSFECTGSVWFMTDNDEFYNDSTLEQAPLYSAQAHVIYSINRGTWVGVSGAYTYGAESTLNGTELDDQREHLFYSLGFGFPLSAQLLAKIAYVGSHAYRVTGQDFDSVVMGLGYRW